MKTKIGKKFTRCGSGDRTVKRFNVTGLKGACMDADGNELPKGKFVSDVCDNMRKKWNLADTACTREVGCTERRRV